MQPNIIPSIADLINNAVNPVIILLVANGCEFTPTDIEKDFEKILAEHEKPVVYYKWCVEETSMVFPRTQAPVAYFFLPKKQDIIFWRDKNILDTLSEDVNKIHDILKNEKNEPEVSDKDKKIIEDVEATFEKEAQEMDKYPSTFQMARTLVKELWETSKKAARGLPVIVSTEVGLERLQTCEKCEKYDEESSRCRQCGCFMKTKTQLAAASCPLGKWDSIV